MTGVVIAASAGAVIAAIALLVLFKRKKPASGGETLVEAGETSGCSEEDKRVVLQECRKLYSEAQKVYGEIQNLLREKKLPPQLEEEYRNFLRIYDLLQDLEREIELYPASNCREYFREKINFYGRLIEEFHSKVFQYLQT